MVTWLSRYDASRIVRLNHHRSAMLNPPGQDNVITFNVGRTQGVMYDALRMEITNTSALHESTGWNDYAVVYGSTEEQADDTLGNNNQ